MSGKAVRVQALTAGAFAPFGRLVERPDRPADVSRPNLDWWGGLYDLDFPDTASLGILAIKRSSFELTMMERHLRAVEVFVPVRGVGVLVFASSLPPPDEAGEADDPGQAQGPDMERVVAFVVDGTAGLVIERGVWHNPGFAITPTLEFLLAVRKHTEDDIEIREVEKHSILL